MSAGGLGAGPHALRRLPVLDLLTVLALLPGLLLAPGCSSAPKGEVRKQITQFYAETLRFRRPEGESAVPRPMPGGSDSLSKPLPDERFDCRTQEEFFSGIQLAALRGCVSAKREPPVQVRYLLKRDNQPFLQLVPAETNPACLTELLPVIPVPREIFFQSPESGEIQCYASRLALDSDRLLGARISKAAVEVVEELPLDRLTLPKDDAAARRMLLAWALTPFFGEGKKAVLDAVYVSERHCIQCLGEKGVVKRGSPPPPLWP